MHGEEEDWASRANTRPVSAQVQQELNWELAWELFASGKIPLTILARLARANPQDSHLFVP